MDYGTKIKIINKDETDAVPIHHQSSYSNKTVSWEDFLIANATIPGYVAHRNTIRGSWFVECVCQESTFCGLAVQIIRITLRQMLLHDKQEISLFYNFI